MTRQRQGKRHLRQTRQLIQQHIHQPRFLAVTLWVFHRQQTKMLDQLPGQRRHLEHPAPRVRPCAILAAHVEAAHFGAHRSHHLVFEIRWNPDAPLRRRKETALGGVYAKNAADRVGKLHPVVAMGRCPGTGIEAFHPGEQRAGQCRQRRNRPLEGKLSVSRH
ncbi:hypothetical protein D3C87_1456330 [compost metagenome]